MRRIEPMADVTTKRGEVTVPPISFTAPPATSAPVVAPTATPPAPVAPTMPPASTNVSSVLAPAKVSEYNRTNTNFRVPMPRPKVRGIVIDIHTHLLAARHADAWFEAARHYGIDAFVTMSPLEEAIVLQRNWPGKLQFIAIPKWGENNFDDWHRRLESF